MNSLGGWAWFYYVNGFAHALRLFFLPQYEGVTDRINVNGGTTQMTKEAFAAQQLGLAAADKWQAFGAMMAILFVAWLLMLRFYVAINHQKR